MRYSHGQKKRDSMKAIYLLSAILITFAFRSHGQELATYSKPEYSINYPADWIMDDSGNAGSIFLISSKLTDDEDTYQDFIRLNKYLLAPGQGLDSYVEQLVKDIPFFYQQSKIEANQRREKDGLSYQMIEYSGLLNNFGLTVRQMIWVDREYVYVLEFMGNTGSAEKVLSQAILAMNSFTFHSK
jgi:hypothetical protein